MHTLVPITTGFDIVLSQSCVTQGRIVMVAKRAQILIGGSKIKMVTTVKSKITESFNICKVY